MTDVSAAPATAVNPGKGMGIAALVIAFFIPLVGLILGIIARGKSKAAGFTNGPAKAGVILSIVFMVLGIIAIIAFAAGGAALFGGLAQACNDLGPGVWDVDGVTYTCS